jgi:hypothetical protein
MYIFIRSSSNPGPRVLRIINYFINKGQKVVYLSPIRSFDKVNTKYRDWGYLGKYDYFDGSGFFNYLKFIFLINLLIVKKIFQNRKVINLVHFSDLEVALLGTILCKIMGIKFVYNIHDNFFQRYNFNNTIKTLLKYLESLYIYLSHKTIVPENFRKKCYPPFVLKKFQSLGISQILMYLQIGDHFRTKMYLCSMADGYLKIGSLICTSCLQMK